MSIRLLSLLFVGLVGCATLVPMSPEIVQRDGRTVFAGDKEKVFQAVQEALESLNVGVAIAKPETGLIVSKRFVLAAYAVRGRYVATANEDTVSLTVAENVLSMSNAVNRITAPAGAAASAEIDAEEFEAPPETPAAPDAESPPAASPPAEAPAGEAVAQPAPAAPPSTPPASTGEAPPAEDAQ